MKKIVIIGAGPAGLTAAHTLLSKSKNFDITILEAENEIGGISKTIDYKGNKMDIGGHRFFSKSPEINNIWDNILKLQGKPSYDDKILKRNCILKTNGPDPEIENNVMLLRNRISRIFFQNNFFDYPISLTLKTLHKLGIITTIKIGLSFFKSILFKRKETNLENFYINKFGKRLYSMFFENYTEKVWGRHPNKIDASWGSQRVKGVSITTIIKDVFIRFFHIKNINTETSLITNFKYPKFGPGHFYETMAKEVASMGGKIIKNAKVVQLHQQKNMITQISYNQNNKIQNISVDYLISSMPLKDLVLELNNIPADVKNIGKNLPYRDFITLGVLVKKLNLKNTTKLKTINNIIPDCWIYIQDKNVKMGRIQIFNNWSPYLVNDINNTIWIGLEYFVQENDIFWNMEEKEFADFAINEMIKIGLIDNKNEVLDYHEEKIKKAYPAYFDSYNQIDKLKNYLNTIENLYCIGRNGQHRYNNMDHSMMTGIKSAEHILNNNFNKAEIWNINTEKEYHETKDKKYK